MHVPPAFDAPPDVPVCVAFSGGMDSTALLHALAHNGTVRALGLRALHVHHGLSDSADVWAAGCAATCAAWGVPFDVVRVQVDLSAGLGVEGAARKARLAAFAGALRPGERLALAHHRDDQAETFLLRALRGSGVDGLAAMLTLRPLGAGQLWRPWLGVPRAAIAAYARAHDLHWIDDPANDALRFDRNFLRFHVLPLLRDRWPHADASFARSAALAADAGAALRLQDHDALIAARGAHPATLDVQAVLGLPPERRARVFRLWVADLGLPPLPSRGVDAMENVLLHARPDSAATFEWASVRIRRWRGDLHAGWSPGAPPAYAHCWDGATPLRSDQGDELSLSGADALPEPVSVARRAGGERIRLPGRPHHHALKHVLQDLAIPPWIRPRLPLLFAHDGELLAAGPVVSARLEKTLTVRGARLCWRPAPGELPAAAD